jgi:hypothetical protein
MMRSLALLHSTCGCGRTGGSQGAEPGPPGAADAHDQSPAALLRLAASVAHVLLGAICSGSPQKALGTLKSGVRTLDA